MVAILIATSFMIAERACYLEHVFQTQIRILSEKRTSREDRWSALKWLRHVSLLSDPRLTRLYERQIRSPSFRRDVIIREICSDEFFVRNNFLLAVDIMRADPHCAKTILELANDARPRWVHDKEIVPVLSKSVCDYYKRVINLDPKLGIPGKTVDQLDGWIEFSYCLAYLDDGRFTELWKRGLSDKREMTDLYFFAHGPNHPIPARICDHCLILILIKHGVDYNRVLNDYGAEKVVTAGTRLREVNSAVFDAAIKDYDAIAKRYFKPNSDSPRRHGDRSPSKP